MKKKKIILLAVTLLILLTGCSLKNIDDYEVEDLINEALSTNISVTNEVYSGYQYYLPRGCKLKDNNGNNSKILFKKDTLYLFVDVVSFYHNVKVEYNEKENLYFSKKISYNDIEGYIEIEELEKKYYIKLEYNYSKIEGYVNKNNLKEAVYNSIIILSSVKYNDNILSTTIGNNQLNYKEEKFSLFDSQREEGNFLDYIEEYDIYKEDEKIKDEDFIAKNEE